MTSTAKSTSVGKIEQQLPKKKTVNQQSKDKQKLADRQPLLLQGTVVGCISCIKN